MNKIKNLSKSLISFFLVISFVVSSTAAFAEIVGRLSVHWSPKHHSAKHSQIFAKVTIWLYQLVSLRKKIKVFLILWS